jgi:hypothetical protein
MRIGRIVAAGVMTAALLLGTGSGVYAQGAQPGLSADGTIREALSKLGRGREVEIVIADGKSYRGKIAEVGMQTVLLTQIAGKEFYDVLLNLDAIAAVEVKAR